ncbi:unnamed protein product [Bursaphelenchus xylophilus]|uniref:(pine wood nematode) hypothetical protein n=1 Tax=Bursaphelenchus xylophilus TaxID=6326 RepID=A0A1I7SSI7_BURXY|nr:unnamed protein product [Bursaphelenchus xylophilus]CAG9097506.1 unnamed protein product [Bursaphelenchus xylophilus]
MPPIWFLISFVPGVYLSYRILRTLFALIWAITLYKIIPIFYGTALQKYKSRWTVVSGGTDGIGKAYMFELAKNGLKKFIIVGRNEKKLAIVKKELEDDYDCQVMTYLFDFFDGDFKELRQYLSDKNIGFVVNSVGVGRKYLERYGDRPEADYQMLKVNGLGSAEFMSCVLPPMEKNGGGQMVVLSSTQGIRPIPLLAAYSSTKSLISFLCECIDREYKTINVQCLMPALVATNMTYYNKGSLFVVTPEQFAKEALRTLGLSKCTSGCFNHELQCLLRHFFPWALLKHMMMPIYWKQQQRMLKLHGEDGAIRPDIDPVDLNGNSDAKKASPNGTSCIPRKISRASVLEDNRSRA